MTAGQGRGLLGGLLAKRACFDSHSNETIWPWYAHVAPMKWLVVHDVEEGRAVFNFSDRHSGDMSGQEAARVISSSRMPLPQYLLMHPEARLTNAEKQRPATRYKPLRSQSSPQGLPFSSASQSNPSANGQPGRRTTPDLYSKIQAICEFTCLPTTNAVDATREM